MTGKTNEQMYKMPFISVIIVNFRQKDFTKNCVESLLRKIPEDSAEIIIVNNSPEEPLEDAIIPAGKVSIINSQNKGFPHANNLAAARACGEFLLFLNPDTIVEDDFVAEFMQTGLPDDFGAGGLPLVHPDGTFQLSYWKENNFFNEILNKRAEEKYSFGESIAVSSRPGSPPEATEVDWVSGAAMIIRRNEFESLGGFDESFFLFYEDADLCKRLRMKGKKIYFLPFGKVIHYKGENVNEKFISNTYYYAKESQLLYYRKFNGIIDRALLRFYLFSKFFYRYIKTRSRIDRDILKLLAGSKRK